MQTSTKAVSKILAFALLCLLICGETAQATIKTYSLAASQDDTRAISNAADLNQFTLVVVKFGRYEQLGGNYDVATFLRYALDIPRGAKIISAKLVFTAQADRTGAFNTYIARLDPAGANAWEGVNGFHTDNYADATALLAISQDATQISYTPASWSAEGEYDSADITTLLQEQVDDSAYDPDSTNYIGLYIDDGDGDYISIGTTSDERVPYAYDNGSKDVELVVEYFVQSGIIATPMTP